MKNLSTLVKDIYAALNPLTKGEAIAITDEQIDEFGESIKNALRQWARPGERNSQFNLRMSNIGRPARFLWFDRRSSSEDNTMLESTMIKFLYGHMLEEILILFAKLSGHTVTDEQKQVEVSDVQGHIDCKIDGEVVDIKTASNYAYKKFSEQTLRDDDPFGYIAQLSGYEEAEGTTEGGFLVINKETGQLCLYQPGELDKINVKSKIGSLKKAIDSDEKPPLCYQPVPEGKKGNMKLHRNCTYCNFKFDCFEDANNGKGLRVFQYAKGPMYFTRVTAPPKVQEITP